MKPEQLNDWYPSSHQLKTPEDTERTLREVLRQFYTLRDSHAALQDQVKQNSKEAVPAQTNTASVQRFLGLPVEPADTTQLTNGAVPTYDKTNRRWVCQ